MCKTKAFAALAAAACIALTAPPAQAEAFVESYCTTLSYADHFASDGYRLDTAAQIIRQDRANFHALGKPDPGDGWDSVFAKKANRAKLEAMLNNGAIDRYTAQQIVNGTPDICVDVYTNSISVYLM